MYLDGSGETWLRGLGSRLPTLMGGCVNRRCTTSVDHQSCGLPVDDTTICGVCARRFTRTVVHNPVRYVSRPGTFVNYTPTYNPPPVQRGNPVATPHRKARRIEAGLTQEDVRLRSGLSVTTIAKIEAGDASVSRASFDRYDDALSPGWLLSEDVGRLVESLAPLVAERLLARRAPADAMISVAGLPEVLVAVVERLVIDLRRALGG